jgi:endoglycosylceramidase
MRILILIFLLPSLAWPKFLSDLGLPNDPRENIISIRPKEYQGIRDWVFVDGFGREVSFRGIHLSNRSKSRANNFLPFKNLVQTQMEIEAFKRYLGGNLIRWLFNWGAIIQGPGKVNFIYLDNQIAQIKIAIQYGIHIVVNFHQDLLGIRSNGTYNGGNGPPAWIYDALKLPPGNCGKICTSKNQNFVTNKRVRAAFNRFWNNATFDTSSGKRYFQDEYFFMLISTMKYMKEKLTPYEWSFILGIDPLNEPIPGDYEEKEGFTQWINNKLFPFYQKIRITLNSQGMADKLVFAEPPTFWIPKAPLAFMTQPLGIISPAIPILPGFVFNAHRFDEVRESLGIRVPRNGIYIKPTDLLRAEARKMAAPSLLTEYGLWNQEKRKNIIDPQMLLKADFQAMEISFPQGKFANFYSPLISGTQWGWDLVGYNPLNFGHGISKNKAHYEDLGYRAIERAYPRRIQGDLMHFYYNDGAKNYFNLKEMDWVGIRTEDLKNTNDNKSLFSNNKFVFMVSRGKLSNSPSEIFLPRNFDISKTFVITDEKVIEKPSVFPDSPLGGNRFLISSENDSIYHFVLILEKGSTDIFSSEQLEDLRKKLSNWISQEKSPIFFTEKI